MSAADRIVLDGEVTIYRAAELRELLVARFGDTSQAVDIDLSNVTELDSSGVQLLLAAKRLAQTAGRPITLSDPSEAVRDVFALMNLEPLFEPDALWVTRQSGVPL